MFLLAEEVAPASEAFAQKFADILAAARSFMAATHSLEWKSPVRLNPSFEAGTSQPHLANARKLRC